MLPRGSLVETGLDDFDIFCLPTLGAFDNVELHRLTFLQAAKAIGLDRRVMDKYIRPVPAAEKTKSLLIVKPLDRSLFHNSLSKN